MLKRTPGISSWKVCDKNFNWYNSLEEVPEDNPVKQTWVPSMFAPDPKTVADLHLERWYGHKKNFNIFI